MSDTEIIDAFFRRDEDAIKQTHGRFYGYIYSLVYNIIGNREDAEECVNDTYVKVWNAIPPERPRVLRAFLSRIARNTALDRYAEARRRGRVPRELCASLDELDGLIADMPDEEPGEIGRIISDWLLSVGERRRYIFLSRYYFARPISEIAKRLSLSESSINKEIAAIKRELGEKLNVR